MQDPHLVSALDKTIPVVSVLEDGSTVHLVSGNKVALPCISIFDLPHPKYTAEIILNVEEINAVIACGNAVLADKVLFVNSRDIRDTGSESESFKVGMVDRICYLDVYVCFWKFRCSDICSPPLCTPPTQRQAKRRYIRLIDQGANMLELMGRDMATVQSPKCYAIKKHSQDKIVCGCSTCMALLSCNNHKAYGKWGDVPLGL